MVVSWPPHSNDLRFGGVGSLTPNLLTLVTVSVERVSSEQ
jgi:hypothetical protein